MYVFIGNFFKKKQKQRLLCAFVCPFWFKETRGLHSVRRSRAPTSNHEILFFILRFTFGLSFFLTHPKITHAFLM
jgi:hypothetical protein